MNKEFESKIKKLINKGYSVLQRISNTNADVCILQKEKNIITVTLDKNTNQVSELVKSSHYDRGNLVEDNDSDIEYLKKEFNI